MSFCELPAFLVRVKSFNLFSFSCPFSSLYLQGKEKKKNEKEEKTRCFSTPFGRFD